MDNAQKLKPDQWEIALDKKLVVLQECQKEHNVSSCTHCSKMFHCTLRKEYVLAVYNSMNKGAGGGFEF